MSSALQTTKDPAATAIAPGHGSNIPKQETKMNSQDISTRPASPPVPFHNPIDEVHRAKSIVLTVWMAMHYPDIEGGCTGDVGALSDVLYEAFVRLGNAEKAMGGDHG